MSLLNRRRAIIMAQNKSDIVLPKEYTKLNYIEGTGTQWIDTGYACTSDYKPYRIKCRFRMTSIPTATQFIFGTNQHPSGVAYVISLSVDASRKKFVTSRLGTSGSGFRFGTLDTEVHDYEYVFKEGSYFDGAFVEGTEQQASLTGISSGKNMGLFARLDTGVNTATLGKCQIYGYELYGKTELERKFVPAQRKSDGVIGMYDIVTNVFVTNSGTGEFIGG